MFVISFFLFITLSNTAQTSLPIEPPPTLQALPIEVQAVIQQSGYLKASNAGAGDFFGISVALDGDTLAVGAYLEDGNGSSPDDNSALDAGTVYIFQRQGANWVQTAYLKASNAGAGDEFGKAVALDGNTLVVGAYGEDSNGSGPDDNSALGAGAVYVFQRQGAAWVQTAYLKASNAAGGDNFGRSVVLDGDTLAVGALGEDSNGSSPDDNSTAAAGAVYIFQRQGAAWIQAAYLKASNAGANDLFSFPVALDGDTLAVGALGEDSNGSSSGDNSAADAGAVYVFQRQGAAWVQTAYLKASNAGAGDQFGSAVALNGEKLVAGAPFERSNGSSPNDNSTDAVGAVYVFQLQGTAWVQTAYLKASNAGVNDLFGYEVALNGNTLAVGAPFESGNGSSPSDNSATAAGAIYIFQQQGGWGQTAYLKASNAESGDNFGSSIALDGDTLAVGAPGEDSNGSSANDNSTAAAGAVYIIDVLPEFNPSPALPGPLVMNSAAPTTTFTIDNRATGSFLLNVVWIRSRLAIRLPAACPSLAYPARPAR
ncbi:MAG: hypothetical protein OHK0046_13620 [Anaerolineae bacterium]